jgi:hypothetical protein
MAENKYTHTGWFKILAYDSKKFYEKRLAYKIVFVPYKYATDSSEFYGHKIIFVCSRQKCVCECENIYINGVTFLVLCVMSF